MATVLYNIISLQDTFMDLYHICRQSDKFDFTKGYIGVSKSVIKRFEEHKKGTNMHLKYALEKYNDIIMYVISKGTQEEVLSQELLLRPEDDIGWNIVKGGGYPPRTKKFKIVSCPHCSKTGGINGMTRCHFDNCKHNPDKSTKNTTKKRAPKRDRIYCELCGGSDEKQGRISHKLTCELFVRTNSPKKGKANHSNYCNWATPAGVFETLLEAAEAHEVYAATIHKRMNSTLHAEWFKIYDIGEEDHE